MIVVFLLILSVNAEIPNDLQYLNELPLEKLVQLKSSLQELVTTYNNATTTPHFENFGAQALALNSAPVKRTDYDVYKKDSSSKLSTLFTMSVTTLAFLAFGGYLLCLIVQAVKAKHSYSNTATATPTTYLISASNIIKKKPQTQFASYGRRKRRSEDSLQHLELPPDEMFDVLLRLCESYARWTESYGYEDV